MNQSDELANLAARCEREEPSRELDAKIWLATGGIKHDKQAMWDAPIPLNVYAEISCDHTWSRQPTRNMAAAVKLVPLVDGRPWFWRAGSGSERPGWAHLNKFHPDHCDRGDEVTAYAKTPELALSAAALYARAAVAKQTEASNTRSEGNPS